MYRTTSSLVNVYHSQGFPPYFSQKWFELAPLRVALAQLSSLGFYCANPFRYVVEGSEMRCFFFLLTFIHFHATSMSLSSLLFQLLSLQQCCELCSSRDPSTAGRVWWIPSQSQGAPAKAFPRKGDRKHCLWNFSLTESFSHILCIWDGRPVFLHAPSKQAVTLVSEAVSSDLETHWTKNVYNLFFSLDFLFFIDFPFLAQDWSPAKYQFTYRFC